MRSSRVGSSTSKKMTSDGQDQGSEERNQQAEKIAENWRRVVERVHAAAERAGREPAEVAIVAVSKTHSAADALAVLKAGARDLGENYVQEMVEKREELEARGAPPVRWHFIGHLQRNKVKYLTPFCAMIHAVDSERLAVEIDRRASEQGRRQAVLVEVNVSGEASKFGVAPEAVTSLVEVLEGLEWVELRGLMTMAPYSEDSEASRPIYRRLRQLAEKLRASGAPSKVLSELSMGMTQDFEVAIEEGATLVRIGTAIFGPRT